jgi:DSS1/SEM1 family
MENMEVEENKQFVFQEDDELEEFQEENWDEAKQDEFDVKQWEEDWDDDLPEDSFTQQLRQELLK